MSPISSANIRWRLKQVHGGEIFDVNGTDNFKVGRSQTAQITLISTKASRTHSSFVVNFEGHLLVQDLNSSNGTFVNGTQITVYVLHRVFPGDIISFGVAHIDLSENDKDKQNFFIVIHQELPIQNIPFVEASLADSTSDLRENAVLNLMNSNIFSAISSTAEIGVNSFLEVPCVPKQDHIDIIDITSCDGDISDVELDDCLGDDNQAHLIIEDIPLISDGSLQRKQINSKNWLQKQPTPIGHTRRSNNLRDIRSVESISNVTTSQLVKNSPRTYNRGNNIHTNSDTVKTPSTYLKSSRDIGKSYLNVSNHEEKLVVNINLRRKSLASAGHDDNYRKTEIRRKSVAEEPSNTILAQEQPNKTNIEYLKKSKNKGTSKDSAAVSSRQTSTKGMSGMSGVKKKARDEPFVKYVPQRKSWAGDAPNVTKDSKQAESPAKKESGHKILLDTEKIKGTRAEASRKTSRDVIDHREKNKNVKKSDKDHLLKGTSQFGNDKSDHDFISQLEKGIKVQPPHNHKKVKIDDCGEFTVSHTVSSPRYTEPEKSWLIDEPIISENKNPKEESKQKIGITKDSENGHKLQNKHEEDKIDCVVLYSSSKNTGGEILKCDDENLGFSDPSSKNNKYLEKSFTTNKDNSVIIDITDEDEDIDFSCSQIFHMSEIVKSETQDDDAFQKIKNELAEMEFCQEETIVNLVPINLENDLSGFDNTQDICACLEEGVQENENAIEFVSNEDNEELINILGDLDKEADNEDNIPYAEDMEVSVNELILPDNNHKSSADDASYDKIDSVTFFGKPKYVKPPLVEPHSITKPQKDPPKKSPSKQYIHANTEETKTTKRKNSLETPAKKKKLKGSPRSVAEPPRCDAKSIQQEFKKRNSGSKVDQDTLDKNNIREERRKKLKEISDRSASLKATETRFCKGNTVKVLPESKTRRGTFLLEEPKRSRGDSMKSNSTKNPSVLKDLVVNESSNNKTIRKNSGRGLDTIENHSNLKAPSRPKTPNTELGGYKLKPLDFAVSSNYNLRRTKSSGDIKADLLKPNDQLRNPQARYNLRHSTALEDNQKDPRRKVDLTASKHAVPPYPSGASFRPPSANQTPQYVVPSLTNQINTSETVCYNTNPVTTNEMSRRLMWTNGGPTKTRKAPIKRLPNVDEEVRKMVNWLPNWLTEQVNIDYSAPVNSPPAGNIPLHFNNFEQYRDTFSKLVLLENWQYLFKGFREGAEQPRKVKIQHVRVANELTTMDCVCYISQKELKQGLFYKPEDFVLLEFVVNDQSNSYISVNFGFIQRCKKSIISNSDFIVVKPDMRQGDFCQGEPHAKLEFSIVTRYQPGKEITTKKYPIVKVLANVRAHLMMIKAIKVLADSPLCSKILHPKINEFKFPVTHRDIIQPHSLNTQQRSIVLEAASLCTGNDPGIYCIKGPPGTGKSTVIVNLVFQILFSHYVTKKTQKPPMILLAAPSNTAVDNLLSKLTAFKHNLGSAWDKHKANIKCVRIGPESSISKELIGYSLPKLAEKHIPLKHMDVPEFRAAWEKNKNLLGFAKTFFGDRYGYEIKACEDLIIQKSNIICTTLNSCINGKLIEAVNRELIQFTCCIIDESTQCHEVESLLPTILGIDKIVLVGDPKQLNATIMNRDASKLGFGESLFSRIGNNFLNDPRTPIKMLTEQYRMHPEICAFPNKHFYEGKLRSLAKPVNKLPEKIRQYLVFNCEKIHDSSDYTNIDEVNLIKKLLSTIFGMIDGNHKYTVGIITPYNAQKALINRNIMELASKNSNFKITVNTVDSFQGSENDIIIISCVRDSTNSFLQNENRLNVALTRAKQALYIVGNYTLFKECKTLYDLREDAKKRKLLLDIRQDPSTIDNFSRYLIKRHSTE